MGIPRWHNHMFVRRAFKELGVYSIVVDDMKLEVKYTTSDNHGQNLLLGHRVLVKLLKSKISCKCTGWIVKSL